MKRFGTLFVAMLLTLGVAQSAFAASIVVCADGACVTGPGMLDVSPTAGQIVITVGLDASTVSNGYEFFFSYDPTELMPSQSVYNPSLADSAHQLYADSVLQPDTFPFTTAPIPCTNTSNCRVSLLSLSPFASQDLFSITFDVVGVDADGRSDFEIFDGGLGGDAVLEGLPAGINLVPEPGTLALLGFGMAGLALQGRRRR